MKLLLMSLLVFTSHSSIAKGPVYKSWKTFQSDYGYEFKYPDCWEVKSDDIDGEGPLSRHAGIYVDGTGSCVALPQKQYVRSGLSIVPIPTTMKESEMLKIFEDHESSSLYKLKNQEWLLFKRFKINESDEAIVYIENFKTKNPRYIRWHYEVLCKSRLVVMRGPSLENPPVEILKKISQGDFSIPEPQKTIFESFRCTESKIRKK